MCLGARGERGEIWLIRGSDCLEFSVRPGRRHTNGKGNGIPYGGAGVTNDPVEQTGTEQLELWMEGKAGGGGEGNWGDMASQYPQTE